MDTTPREVHGETVWCYLVLSSYIVIDYFCWVDNADLKKPRSSPKGRQGSTLSGTTKNTSRIVIETQNAQNRKKEWIHRSRKGIAEGTMGMFRLWGPGCNDRGILLARAQLEILGRSAVGRFAMLILVGLRYLVLRESPRRTIKTLIWIKIPIQTATAVHLPK